LGPRNETVNPEINNKILEGCKKLIPECLDENGEFKVLKECVGLRPHRKGGPRVEIEKVKDLSGGGDIVVIHNYGHGPGG
jgi:D-amino-acid oxidase